MIVCPVCQHHNAEYLQACQSCGAGLDEFVYRACPACGALNGADARFCHRCLTRLSGEEDAPEAPEEGGVAAAPIPNDDALVAEEAAAAPVPPPTEFAEEPEAAEKPRAASEDEERASRATPTALRAASHGAQETVLDIPSPLEGVHDAIPLETVVALPHRAEALIRPTSGEVQRRDADLFQRIATEPASLYEQAQRVLPRPLADVPRLGRRLLYLLVLVAALVPLFSGGLLNMWVRPGDEVSALADTLRSLPAGARVLLSFDYDPAYAGELDPLAVAVTRQLAGRGVHMVAMSTRPGGVGLAERILAQATAGLSDYRYGQQYALLGYLPDQQAGLRLLTDGLQTAFPADTIQQSALADLAVTRNLTGVGDFQHVIVFADDSQTVRHWVEQVHSRTGAPLHALVTQRVAPVLLPYAEAGQLASLVGAAAGGAEMEAATGFAGQALRGVDGYLALFIVLLLVAVIANAVDIGRAKRSKRRA
jgi:hypothetical protein